MKVTVLVGSPERNREWGSLAARCLHAYTVCKDNRTGSRLGTTALDGHSMKAYSMGERQPGRHVRPHHATHCDTLRGICYAVDGCYKVVKPPAFTGPMQRALSVRIKVAGPCMLKTPSLCKSC